METAERRGIYCCGYHVNQQSYCPTCRQPWPMANGMSSGGEQIIAAHGDGTVEVHPKVDRS
jgi:hypothetical protein